MITTLRARRGRTRNQATHTVLWLSALAGFALLAFACGRQPATTAETTTATAAGTSAPAAVETSAASAEAASASGHGSRMMSYFSGVVVLAEDGTIESVEVAPVLTLETRRVERPLREGDYLLEFLDANGDVLRSVSFAYPEVACDEMEDCDELWRHEYWYVRVYDPPEYVSYRVSRRSEVVAQVARSLNAPVVSILEPAGGEVFDGGTVEVSWEGFDADGDELEYWVSFSTNGGATYQTLAQRLEGSSVSLKHGDLTGSDSARIQVRALDGTRTTTAESEIFTVTPKPPQMWITAPEDGAIFGGLARVRLRAVALDHEDLTIEDSAINWSSDIDGPLGSGELSLWALEELSEGTHVITATVTDSSGATASAEITIDVRALNEPPQALDDAAHAQVGETIVVDVIANDSDLEDQIAPRDLNIVAPPALGAAAVVDGGESGYAIEYVAEEAGFDTLVYEICDRAGQCATAQLTITIRDNT